MWTYDVDTDTWTEIDQGTILPPPAAVDRPVGNGTDRVIYTFAQALTYDASVDRLILADDRSTWEDDRSTWEFDIRAGRWEEHLILEGKRCHEAKAADVDGDGDVDICTKPWHGNLHLYLRNMLVEDSKS